MMINYQFVRKNYEKRNRK